MPQKTIKPICVEPNTCMTARGKQELYFALEKKGIALVFYAAVPGYSNGSGHRKIIHIESKEFILSLLNEAAEDLRGEEFTLTLYKPTQENSSDEVNKLMQFTKLACSQVFPHKIMGKEVAVDCGKLCLNGEIESYRPIKEKSSYAFSSYLSNLLRL